MTAGEMWRAARALAVRPGLWPTAIRVGRRTAQPGWWRRWPPVPAPSPAYARFRIETFYGDRQEDGADEWMADERVADELVAYLGWCRRMKALAR